MSNAAKLKKKAVELEQKKQLDKALALYIQFLQESDGSLDDIDIPLYNRVGDILIRTGNASDALNYYEKAVDLYADRGFHNNAIALCNKVLRQSPGRASIYYKLGKISATKGFKNDAKKNFLEYADRMQRLGKMDEAFRALKEFADLCPGQDDVRLMLAEQLARANRKEEALEQLELLYDMLESDGRSSEAAATLERIKALDPAFKPRRSTTPRATKKEGLVFLDLDFEGPPAAPENAPEGLELTSLSEPPRAQGVCRPLPGSGRHPADAGRAADEGESPGRGARAAAETARPARQRRPNGGGSRHGRSHEVDRPGRGAACVGVVSPAEVDGPHLPRHVVRAEVFPLARSHARRATAGGAAGERSGPRGSDARRPAGCHRLAGAERRGVGRVRARPRHA
jgi:hypothetical protein